MKAKIRIRKQGRGLIGYFPKKFHFRAGQEVTVEIDDLTASVEEFKVDLDAMKFQIKEELKPQIVSEIKAAMPHLEDVLRFGKFIDKQKDVDQFA